MFLQVHPILTLFLQQYFIEKNSMIIHILKTTSRKVAIHYQQSEKCKIVVKNELNSSEGTLPDLSLDCQTDDRIGLINIFKHTAIYDCNMTRY